MAEASSPTMPSKPVTGELYAKLFWQRFKRVEGGCLEWQGATNDHYYGVVYFLGRQENVHIVAWILTHKFKPTCFVCHTCNNKKCGEPSHLYLADNRKNQLDYRRDRRAVSLHKKMQELAN
jgi:hypothetical protein